MTQAVRPKSAPAKLTLLYVEDTPRGEAEMRRYLDAKKYFAKMLPRIDLIYTDRVSAAAEILRAQPVDILVTDIQPRLIEKALAEHPNIKCVAKAADRETSIVSDFRKEYKEKGIEIPILARLHPNFLGNLHIEIEKVIKSRIAAATPKAATELRA